MNIACTEIMHVFWGILPNFFRTIIKCCYVLLYKKNIPFRLCKNISLWGLMDWSVRIWKNIACWSKSLERIILGWVEIWDYASLGNYISFYSSKKYFVKIWKFCSIASWVSFISWMGHNYNKITTYKAKLKLNDFQDIWKPIIIWNDVRIWKNAIILKWVTVGTWAVIWAWSVVTKDIPPYAIVCGNPARIIKYRFDKDIIKKLLESEWRNRDIEKIKENYNLEFINNLGH